MINPEYSNLFKKIYLPKQKKLKEQHCFIFLRISFMSGFVDIDSHICSCVRFVTVTLHIASERLSENKSQHYA